GFRLPRRHTGSRDARRVRPPDRVARADVAARAPRARAPHRIGGRAADPATGGRALYRDTAAASCRRSRRPGRARGFVPTTAPDRHPRARLAPAAGLASRGHAEGDHGLTPPARSITCAGHRPVAHRYAQSRYGPDRYDRAGYVESLTRRAAQPSASRGATQISQIPTRPATRGAKPRVRRRACIAAGG